MARLGIIATVLLVNFLIGTASAQEDPLDPNGPDSVKIAFGAEPVAGGSNQDGGVGIAVDSSGSAYVTGYTSSTKFPTATPFDGSFNGVQDAFVTKLSSTYSGPDWYVATNGSDETGDGSESYPFATIQHAIDAAANGESVLVADGTYSGPGNTNLDPAGKSIVIRSENGPASCTIECYVQSMPYEILQQGFLFSHGEDTTCVVDGFTITEVISGGMHGAPRIAFTDNSSPKILNCRIIDGGYSSGIAISGSAPVFRDCIFEGNLVGACSACSPPDKHTHNSASLSFGAAGVVTSLNGSSPTLQGCVFTDNLCDAMFGGAIGCDNASITLVDCSFIRNASGGDGESEAGAIYVTNSGSIVASGCQFIENHSNSAGGAIVIDNASTAVMTSCQFLENNCDGSGGAIYCQSSDLELRECLFRGNNVSGRGGAVAARSSTVQMAQCTFMQNRAGVAYNCTGESDCLGGAIYLQASTMAITNSILAANEGRHALWCADGTSIVSVSCTDIVDNELGSENQDWMGCIAGYLGQDGNISIDPLFCDTANGNYSLFNFSPCAATNNSCRQLIGAYDVGCSLVTTLALPDEPSASNVLSHMPHLTWAFGPPSGFQQSEYDIEVGSDNDWAVAEMWDPDVVVSAVSELVYLGAALLDGDSYYVRLRTKLNGSWTPWYETSFRMNSLPAEPILATPQNGAHVGPSVTLFANNATDAEGDPLAYQFEVYRQPQMVDLVEQSDLIAGQADSTGWTVNAYLEENQLYFWRCRAWDGYEYSDWSVVQFFCLDATPEAFGRPALTAPLGENLIVYDMLPTFSWTEVDDPDPLDEVKYRLELSVDENFTRVASSDDLTQPSYQLVDSLLFNTHYWWRVKAFDLGGLFSVSDTADFWGWTPGDVNHNHDMTLGDIMILVDHLFIGNVPIEPPKVGDVNHDCEITLGDIMLMVDNLFISGTELQVGCE